MSHVYQPLAPVAPSSTSRSSSTLGLNHHCLHSTLGDRAHDEYEAVLSSRGRPSSAEAVSAKMALPPHEVASDPRLQPFRSSVVVSGVS